MVLLYAARFLDISPCHPPRESSVVVLDSRPVGEQQVFMFYPPSWPMLSYI